MTSSTIETVGSQKAIKVSVTDEYLIVDLADGRIVSTPISWYPRLLNGSEIERKDWRFTGSGEGIHWPSLDEDVSIKNIILGKPTPIGDFLQR